jgi:hypothetical protein
VLEISPDILEHMDLGAVPSLLTADILRSIWGYNNIASADKERRPLL